MPMITREIPLAFPRAACYNTLEKRRGRFQLAQKPKRNTREVPLPGVACHLAADQTVRLWLHYFRPSHLQMRYVTTPAETETKNAINGESNWAPPLWRKESQPYIIYHARLYLTSFDFAALRTFRKKAQKPQARQLPGRPGVFAVYLSVYSASYFFPKEKVSKRTLYSLEKAAIPRLCAR